jgi:hypothetical protein
MGFVEIQRMLCSHPQKREWGMRGGGAAVTPPPPNTAPGGRGALADCCNAGAARAGGRGRYMYTNESTHSQLSFAPFTLFDGDLQRRSEDSVMLTCPLTGSPNVLSAGRLGDTASAPGCLRPIRLRFL